MTLNHFLSLNKNFKIDNNRLPGVADLDFAYDGKQFNESRIILGLFHLHHQFKLPLTSLLDKINHSFYLDMHFIQDAVHQLFGHDELNVFFNRIQAEFELHALNQIDPVVFHIFSFQHVLTSPSFFYEQLPEFVKSKDMYNALVKRGFIKESTEMIDHYCLNICSIF